MDLPTDISGILSAFGVPGGAIGIAYGLVRGAGALETDAREEALRDVSRLLASDSWANFGKLGATLVPAIFDRIFGSRPFSFKFLSRSIVASVLFWIVLLLAKHADFNNVLSGIAVNGTGTLLGVWLFFCVGWMSLVKARSLINVMGRRTSVLAYVSIVLIDIVLSYLIVDLMIMAVLITGNYLMSVSVLTNVDVYQALVSLLNMRAVTVYVLADGAHMNLTDVIVPSTLMTSMWTLLLVSSLLARILSQLDYLRRFTTWWFKDVEKRPLTAIAKVAATLIIIGAAAIKAVRWL
jgi:hypothetical protein